MSEKLNGKIYMIGSKHTDLVYIGSTCQSLDTRLKQHEYNFNRYKKGKCNNMTSFEILKLKNYYILLLENVKVETKKELEKIEGNYIKKYSNVNRCTPGRTLKEWQTDNKTIIKEKKKDYYQQNKDELIEKQKDYYEENKEKIKIKKNEKIVCPCSSSYSKVNLSHHLKTAKHIKYEQNKTLNL